MKKLFLIIVLAATTALLANAEIKTKTFDFGDISRLSAGNNFQIHVAEGNSQSVKISFDSELEEFIKISYSASNERLSLNMVYDLPRRIKNLKLPPVHVYLEMDTISSIDISGAASVTFDGEFKSDDLDIDMSGAANMNGLNIKGQNLDIDCSGATNVSMNGIFSKDTDIDMSGASQLSIEGEFNTCDVTCSGACKVELRGQAVTAVYECTGACSVDARDIIVRNADVKLLGASSAKVYATDKLSYDVSVASKMTYFGNAELTNTNSSNIVKGD